MNVREGFALALRTAVGTMPALKPNPMAQPTGSVDRLLTGILPGGVGSPPKRGTREFLDAYSAMPLLRMATSRIADAVSSTQWQLFSVKPKGAPKAVAMKSLRRMAMAQRHATLEALRREGSLTEITEHPFLSLLDSANSYHTGKSVRKISQVSVDTVGEFFWFKERNGLGAPIGIWPIPSHWILSTPTPTVRTYRVSFRGWQGEVPDTEMFWACDLDPAHPYARGSGTGFALADDLETDKYAAIMTKQKFFNHMRPDILITAENLSDADTRRLERDWASRHQGMWQQWKARFLNKKVDVHEFDSDLRANQFVQLRQHERDFVAQVYGVPPEILGIVENSNRATIGAAEEIFGRYVLIPRLEFWRTNLQERFIDEYDDRIILDYVSPVSADSEAELKAGAVAPWALTWDEWREKQGAKALEGNKGKDMFFVPGLGKITPLDEILNPPEPVLAPLPGAPNGGPPKPGPPVPRPASPAGAGRALNDWPDSALDSLTDEELAYVLGETDTLPRGYPEFDPDQPRDDSGRWSGDEGGAGDLGISDVPKPPWSGEPEAPGEYDKPKRTRAALTDCVKAGGSIKMDGLDANAKVEAEEALRDLFTDFEIDKFTHISTEAEGVFDLLFSSTPSAIVHPPNQDWDDWIGKRWLYLNPSTLSAEAIRRLDSESQQRLQARLANPPADPEAKAALDRLASYTQPHVGGNITVAGCIVHEVGHMLQSNLDQNSPLFSEDRMALWSHRMNSRRASDNKNEYVAESFMAYRMGHPLDPELAAEFDKMRKT